MLGCGKKFGQPDKRFLCKAGDGAYIGSGPHVFIFAFRNIFCGFLLAAGVPCAFGLFGPPRKSIPPRSPDRWVPGRMRKMSCRRGALRVWAVWTAKEKHPPRSPGRWAPGRPGKIFFRRVSFALGLFGPPRKRISRVPRAVGPRADQGKVSPQRSPGRWAPGGRGKCLAAGVPCAFGLFGPPRKNIPPRSPERWVPGRMREMSCRRGVLLF